MSLLRESGRLGAESEGRVHAWIAICALLLAVVVTDPGQVARATLQTGDQGPVLSPGGFVMRVTNAGILGNAFFDIGLSSDPSFEFPPQSGRELLRSAELWVGAIGPDGRPRVSGGPALEWRPSPEPGDTIMVRQAGDHGSRRGVDNDGDGKVNEELVNGLDDDGDGEVDEDYGLIGQQCLYATYRDDRPEAVGYSGSSGESHQPLGLRVDQRVFGWSVPDARSIAGISFLITNRGAVELRDLWVGLHADLDSRLRTMPTGHLDDRVIRRVYFRSAFEGYSRLTVNGRPVTTTCITNLTDTIAVLEDGRAGSGLPAMALVPLSHTTDPLGLIPEGRSYARAPGHRSFHTTVFVRSGIPGQGGVPTLDLDRYSALRGELPGVSGGSPSDHTVLSSCGPFSRLGPGQSIQVTYALVAGETPDSVVVAAATAAWMERGTRVNLLPDSTGPDADEYTVGRSGLHGHEVCVEPPSGVTFLADPHCTQQAVSPDIVPEPVRYVPGQCVWTNADCDLCTGIDGRETLVPWLDPGEVAPAPDARITPGDHAVTIEWGNRPEVLIRGRQIGGAESVFLGYRVYRLADWRGRASLLPPLDNWALMRAIVCDTCSVSNGETRIGALTDSTVDYDRILFGQPLYPPGRYRMVDSEAKNGFDYLYAVTSVYDSRERLEDGTLVSRRLESPIVATFAQRVTPQSSATSGAGRVWVVPNPFRARADWDRPSVFGDVFTRHVDFMGLPRARSTIRIWTVAGDLVARIDHDGSDGGGQAAWDLFSRNGQEVESGIYLFTVDWPSGHQIGRFVIIR